jgi:hypothetical protein
MHDKEDVVTSVRVTRWVLVGLSALLAVVLVASGHVIVGVVIGAIAVTRGLLFVRMQQRRALVRERLARRRGRAS